MFRQPEITAQEKVAAFRTSLPVEIDFEEVGRESEFDALDSAEGEPGAHFAPFGGTGAEYIEELERAPFLNRDGGGFAGELPDVVAAFAVEMEEVDRQPVRSVEDAGELAAFFQQRTRFVRRDPAQGRSRSSATGRKSSARRKPNRG